MKVTFVSDTSSVLSPQKTKLFFLVSGPKVCTQVAIDQNFSLPLRNVCQNKRTFQHSSLSLREKEALLSQLLLFCFNTKYVGEIERDVGSPSPETSSLRSTGFPRTHHSVFFWKSGFCERENPRLILSRRFPQGSLHKSQRGKCTVITRRKDALGQNRQFLL